MDGQQIKNSFFPLGGRASTFDAFIGAAAGARYTINLTGGGGVVGAATGADITSGGAIAGSAELAFDDFANYNSLAGTKQWFGAGGFKTINAKGSYYFGAGNVTVGAGGHVFTPAHIGFKVIVDGAGVATLRGTQSDGTTEAVTLGIVVVVNDNLQLKWHKYLNNGKYYVDYYYNKNSAGMTFLGTLQLTLPPAAVSGRWAQFSVSNDNNAAQQEFIASAVSMI